MRLKRISERVETVMRNPANPEADHHIIMQAVTQDIGAILLDIKAKVPRGIPGNKCKGYINGILEEIGYGKNGN